jgi:hypothetical protein
MSRQLSQRKLRANMEWAALAWWKSYQQPIIEYDFDLESWMIAQCLDGLSLAVEIGYSGSQSVVLRFSEQSHD